MVDKIFYYNADKFPAIANDYSKIKTRAEKLTNQPETTKKDSLFAYALESVPTFRRVASMPDKLESGDIAPALGLASLALINLPEDLRDVKAAGKQIYSKINKNYHYNPLYDRKNYQHSFSFFRGTAIEEWLHKNVDAGKKWANWLYSNDKTLADTVFGNKITKLLKRRMSDVIETSITDFKKNPAFAFSYEGSLFAELTGKAMRRTTKLGLIALALIEAPKILKSLSKGDNIFEQSKKGAEQTAKSAVNVTSIAAGIGYGGAIGAKYAGATGSIVGMGLGAILGSKLSDKVQNLIQ